MRNECAFFFILLIKTAAYRPLGQLLGVGPRSAFILWLKGARLYSYGGCQDDVEQFEEPSEQEVLDQLDQVESEESEEEVDQVEEDNESVEEDKPEEEHGEDISTDNSGS